MSQENCFILKLIWKLLYRTKRRFTFVNIYCIVLSVQTNYILQVVPLIKHVQSLGHGMERWETFTLLQKSLDHHHLVLHRASMTAKITVAEGLLVAGIRFHHCRANLCRASSKLLLDRLNQSEPCYYLKLTLYSINWFVFACKRGVAFWVYYVLICFGLVTRSLNLYLSYNVEACYVCSILCIIVSERSSSAT